MGNDRQQLQVQLDATASALGWQPFEGATWIANGWRIGVARDEPPRFLAFSQGHLATLDTIDEVRGFVADASATVPVQRWEPLTSGLSESSDRYIESRWQFLFGPIRSTFGAVRQLSWRLKVAAIIGALILGLVAFVIVRPSKDERYLNELRAEGLAGQFSSDANALAAGKQTCARFSRGDTTQGEPVDKVAVDAFCPEFSDGFKILETVTIEGSFTLFDFDSSSIFDIGSGCSGSGGYDDIGEGTDVIVKNDDGETLVRTQLGEGEGSSTVCKFEFEFDITEGEDNYVVSVSHRGEKAYSFTDLKLDGVHLSLG